MAMSQFPCLFQDYELDGVDWTKVEFEDNQECLDLFEKVFLGFTFVSFMCYLVVTSCSEHFQKFLLI